MRPPPFTVAAAVAAMAVSLASQPTLALATPHTLARRRTEQPHIRAAKVQDLVNATAAGPANITQVGPSANATEGSTNPSVASPPPAPAAPTNNTNATPADPNSDADDASDNAPNVSGKVGAAASGQRDDVSAVVVKTPADFIYGCATSAYQVEGAWNEDGRGESNWDAYVHNATDHDQRVLEQATGDVSVDFYHTYREDIPLFRNAFAINTFSFSVAWSRITPTGKETDANKNQKGIDFYKDVIRVTRQSGMSTSCTLFHWDYPQHLEELYGGFMSDDIIEDFANYARIVMTSLGTGCDIWISMNEPRTFCLSSYGPRPFIGAPGRGGTMVQVLECVHRTILAHARAWEIFQELKEKGIVHGRLAIKVDGPPFYPWREGHRDDEIAAQRGSDIAGLGWITAAVTTGDYAPAFIEAVGDHLRRFTPEESARIKDSYDILMWDAYSAIYASWNPENAECAVNSKIWPGCVEQSSVSPTGSVIGETTGSNWNFLRNDTLVQGLTYLWETWHPKAIAIGENGLSLRHSSTLNLSATLHDDARVRWYRSAAEQMNQVLSEGKIPLVGYLFWSCISNFEWVQGYTQDFGVVYAKPGKNEKRHIKESATFLRASLGKEPNRTALDAALAAGAGSAGRGADVGQRWGTAGVVSAVVALALGLAALV